MVYRRRDGTSQTVLDRISLNIAPNEFVCMIGPSGCGKTTLIKIVQGLVTATSGVVQVGGNPVQVAAPDAGFVFQQDSLLPWRTVRANIAFPLELRELGSREKRDRVDVLIDLVGLQGHADSFPHELSGGMRQRVNLARALAPDPQVLIMDEPFAALDSLTRAQMQTELLRICDEEKKTVLFVTHQIDEAVLLGDRVIAMSAGPGRVQDQTDIPIPRPRSADVRTDALFKEKVDHLWRVLHER